MKKQNSEIAVVVNCEAQLVEDQGQLCLMCQGGPTLRLTLHQAQMIYAHDPQFAERLHRHELDERLFDKDLAERLYREYERYEFHPDDNAGTETAIAVLIAEARPWVSARDYYLASVDGLSDKT